MALRFDLVRQQLRLLHKLWFKLRDAVWQVHHRRAQRENKDATADYVTDKLVLTHAIKA